VIGDGSEFLIRRTGLHKNSCVLSAILRTLGNATYFVRKM